MMVDTNYNLLPKSFFDPETKKLRVDEKLAEKVQAGIQARLDKLPDAADEIFQSLTAKLTPGDVDTPEKLDAVLNSFETAARLLEGAETPVAAFVGDIAKFLARAMIEFAGEQRQNALKDRMAAREAAKAELLSQASKMDDAAQKMLAGATTALVMGVVGGAISAAGSAVSAIGALKQIKSMVSSTNDIKTAGANVDQITKIQNRTWQISPSDSAKLQGSLTDANTKLTMATKSFDIASNKAQNLNTFGQAANTIGDMGRSGGAGVDGIMQSEAKKDEAEGARDAAEAQFAQQTADMKKELQDAYNEMIKQIINFLRELKEAEIDAMRALTKV